MAFLGQLGTMLGGILVSMAGQLVTAPFIRAMVVEALEVLVKKTPTDADDRILQKAKEAWGYSSK